MLWGAMIRVFRAALVMLVSSTFSPPASRAERNPWDYSGQVRSAVQVSPPKATLTWPHDTMGVPSSYTVYRKAPDATSWGAGTTLSGSTLSHTDASVTAGQTYEYRIVKAAGSYTGYGY